MTWAVCDTETTGWDKSDTEPQEPIELAALRVTEDFEVVGRFYRRWQPSLPVQPGAAKVNGYNAIDWIDCDAICQVDLVHFASFIDGTEWVGSNPRYDFDLIEAQRIGRRLSPWRLSTHRKVDVGSLGLPLIKARGRKGGLDGIIGALTALGQPAPPMPTDLAEIAGGRIGPHTAMGDAWRTLHAFRCLMQPALTYWRAR